MKASHCGLGWEGVWLMLSQLPYLPSPLLSPSRPFFFFSFFPSFLLPFPFFLSPSLPSHPISLYLSLFPSISSKGSWFLISFQEHQQVYIKWLVILLGFVFIFLFSIQFWALGDNLNIFLTALYGIVQLRI